MTKSAQTVTVTIALSAAIVVASIAGLLVRPHAVSIDAPALNAQAAPALAALGALDTLVVGNVNVTVGDGTTIVRARRRVTLYGWAIPAKPAPAAVGIEASYDGGRWYAGQYGLPRPGLAQALGRADAGASGFTVPIDTGSPGMHVLTCRLLLSDGGRTLLGRQLRLQVIP